MRGVRHIVGKIIVLFVLYIGIGAETNAHILPIPRKDTSFASTSSEQTIVLAGGCFWGIQAVYQHVKGVKQAVSGYAGGKAETAYYKQVTQGDTGHAEAVQVTYDPSQITVGKILQIFFAVAHNPTELNRQGPDMGTQYRSAIFYANKEQQDIAAAYIAQLQEAKHFDQPIVTTLEPLRVFYPAETYHQDYVKKHPANTYVVVHDLPKLKHLRDVFPALYVE